MATVVIRTRVIHIVYAIEHPPLPPPNLLTVHYMSMYMCACDVNTEIWGGIRSALCAPHKYDLQCMFATKSASRHLSHQQFQTNRADRGKLIAERHQQNAHAHIRIYRHAKRARTMYTHTHKLAQSYAMRVWNGISVTVCKLLAYTNQQHTSIHICST